MYIGIPMNILAAERAFLHDFCYSSVSLWNNLANSVFDVVGLAGFKSGAIFFIGLSY